MVTQPFPIKFVPYYWDVKPDFHLFTHGSKISVVQKPRKPFRTIYKNQGGEGRTSLAIQWLRLHAFRG